MTDDIKNLVWIELEKPRDDAHAEACCVAANRMLARLIKTEDLKTLQEFWWDADDHIYCYGGPMGYTTLGDRGKWFNLDYLGRP